MGLYTCISQPPSRLCLDASANLPRFGYFRPSNLVRHPVDKMYYALIHADNGRTQDHPAQVTGQCVIRTATPTVPSSWRAWGGADFNISFVDPFRAGPEMVPEQHVCAPVSNTAEGIGSMGTHLSYNTHFKKWMTLGSLGTPSLGVPGVINSGNWSYEAIVSDSIGCVCRVRSRPMMYVRMHAWYTLILGS